MICMFYVYTVLYSCKICTCDWSAWKQKQKQNPWYRQDVIINRSRWKVTTCMAMLRKERKKKNKEYVLFIIFFFKVVDWFLAPSGCCCQPFKSWSCFVFLLTSHLMSLWPCYMIHYIFLCLVFICYMPRTTTAFVCLAIILLLLLLSFCIVV